MNTTTTTNRRMTRAQAHSLYMRAKRDLSKKTIRTSGKTGTVVNVYEATYGPVCDVKLEDGTHMMVVPTRDEIEIVTTYYTIELDDLLAGEHA